MKPQCECSDLAAAGMDFEQAVADAYTALELECGDDDAQTMLLRMQHFASSAAMALLDGDVKFYVSCLVNNAALSRLLSSRIFTERETDDDDDDDDEDVASAPPRNS